MGYKDLQANVRRAVKLKRGYILLEVGESVLVKFHHALEHFVVVLERSIRLVSVGHENGVNRRVIWIGRRLIIRGRLDGRRNIRLRLKWMLPLFLASLA